MATTEDNSFEIERRVILFKPTTTLPDDSALGYDGDPNVVINGNTAGETLIYNCPRNTRYSESSGIEWVKNTLPNTWVRFGIKTFIELEDTPSAYDDGKCLVSTTSGTVWTTTSGGVHSELDNLDYASSGHTGFQASGDYTTNSELTTVSGDLQTNIDGKADTIHSHDDLYYTETELDAGQLDNRYYTETEVDTISGSLDTKIDGKANTVHTHDDRYYTESEVDDLLTTISGAGGGGGLTWELIDSDTNAESDYGYLINASGGNITLTLSASPSVGDSVGACDVYNKATTNTITVARNSNNIEGIAEDLIIDINGSGFTLVYVDATRGWEIISEISGGGGYVSDAAYSGDWNGIITTAPSKNAVYDEMETKSDTDHLHDDRYYTESEVDDLVVSVSGTTDHSELNNLDYENSGHTGFQVSGDYTTDVELTTLSGALKNDIDGKADTDHTHDDRYYTESEVDTISGSLQTNIDGKVGTIHSHDDRYYTEAEVNTISGSLSAEIDSDISTHSSSADHDDRYYTESEVDDLLTTISGAGGGGGLTWELIDSDTNAESDYGYLINASGGNITLTLSASPSVGDSVGACDVYNKATTNTITVARNSNNIEGIAEDLIIDINGSGFTLVYVDATRGWEIISEISGGGGVGDVTAAVNIDANAVVVGDDGTKGIKAAAPGGVAHGFMIDVVQAEDSGIVDNDTLDLIFDFVPSKIVIQTGGRCDHITTSEGGVGNSFCEVLITGVDTFTSNMGCWAIYNLNSIPTSAGAIGDATNILYISGGHDGSNAANFLATGAWVTATKTFTLTFQETVSVTTNNVATIIATAYA